MCFTVVAARPSATLRSTWDGLAGRHLNAVEATFDVDSVIAQSGAQASRFMVLTLTESFYAREDHALTERAARQPARHPQLGHSGLRNACAVEAGFSSRHSPPRQLRNSRTWPLRSAPSSATAAPLPPADRSKRRSCLMPGQPWCAAQGRDHAGTVQTFGRDLRAAVPGLKAHAVKSCRFSKGLRGCRTWMNGSGVTQCHA